MNKLNVNIAINRRKNNKYIVLGIDTKQIVIFFFVIEKEKNNVRK